YRSGQLNNRRNIGFPVFSPVLPPKLAWRCVLPQSWVSAVFPFKCAKNEAPVCLERSFFAVLIPVLPPKLDDAVFAVFSSVNSPISGRGVANSAYPLYIRITATRFPHGFR